METLTIVIDLTAIAISDVSQLISGFGKMTNLRSLDITLMNVTNAKHILIGLTQIGKNCHQMTDLSICLLFDRTLSTVEDHHLIQLSSFANFTSLSSLKITIQKTFRVIGNKKFNFGSFEVLKDLTNLKHLSLDLGYVEDNTFENIGLYLPQLESVVIKSNRPLLSKQFLSDKTLYHLSELRSLRSLELEIHDIAMTTAHHTHQVANMLLTHGLHLPAHLTAPLVTPRVSATITDSGIKQLLDNCVHLQQVSFWEHLMVQNVLA